MIRRILSQYIGQVQGFSGDVSILIFVMDKTRAEFQNRSGWVLRKSFEGGAGTVPLRRRGERSLKPSIFCLAGAKDACF